MCFVESKMCFLLMAQNFSCCSSQIIIYNEPIPKRPLFYCMIVERLLAAQNPLSHADRPHQLFADAPPMGPGGIPLSVPMMPPPPPPGQPVNIPPPLGSMIPPPMNIPPPAR